MRNFNILIFHALLVLFSIVGFNSATENEEMKCKERERRALLKFKQSLQDESGMLSTWKDDPNADCCKWKGVQCNYQTDLSSNQLEGELPNCWNNLTSLQFVDLSNNKKCPGEEPARPRVPMTNDGGDENSIFLEALYMGMGIGFFIGFVGLVGSILLLPSWRETYSRFLNTLILKVFKWWKQLMYVAV
ncbi:hypothetical protein P8452_10173 [Trifolium repens]|nr:hypothetical protein P8452_10173 [Trifolium repens]